MKHLKRIVLAILAIGLVAGVLFVDKKAFSPKEPGQVAGTSTNPLLVGNKLCDNSDPTQQAGCTSYIPEVLAASTASPYQDVQGDVLISGNVGIGTVNPGTMLQVGDRTSTISPYITIDSATTAQAAIQWMSAGTQKWVLYRPVNGNDLRLWDAAGVSDRVTFRSGTGNVGIGTTSPGVLLHLNGPFGRIRLDSTNPGASNWGLFPDSSPAGFQVVNLSTSTVPLFIANNGYVGIGTTSPQALLDVRGRIFANAGTAGAPTYSFNNDTNTGLYRKQEDVMAMIANGQEAILMSGTTGVGTLAIGNIVPASEKFLITGSGTSDYMRVSSGNNENGDVFKIARTNGAVSMSSLGTSGYVCSSSGTLSSGASCSASDLRLKKNIVGISSQTNVLNALDKLRGVYFNWDLSNPVNKGYGSTRQLGMIAQDVQKVFPELVETTSDGYLRLNYSQFTGYLVEVAKAQQSQIKALQTENAALKLKVDNLESRLKVLEQKVK